jgi:hypothetical protein
MEQVIGVAKKLSAESDLGDRDLLLDCLRKPEVRADGEVVSQIEKLLANAEASSEAMSVLGEIAATVSAGGSDSTLGRRLVQLAREGKVPSSALQPLAESLATMMVANEKRRNESRPRV